MINLKGVHLLLTYKCNYECDHCFVYSSPSQEGVMTLQQIREIYSQAKVLDTIEWIFIEGGEPFLYYPIMLEAVKTAKDMGFKVGIVTNSYWGTTVEDAKVWLKPFAEIGVDDFSVSDDSFHYEEKKVNLAKIGIEAAKSVGLPAGTISIDKPSVCTPDPEKIKGEPIYKGGPKLVGRAVEKLIEGLPTKPWSEFCECPLENLKNPERVHIDPFGFVHICQGLTMGNIYKTPFDKLVQSYNGETHPICSPLIRGGPAELVREFNLPLKDSYVDACHLCYLARKLLIEKFPEFLAPPIMYGLMESKN